MKRNLFIVMAASVILLAACREKEPSCKIMLPEDEGYVYHEPRLYSEEYMSAAQVYDEATQMGIGDTFYLTGILSTPDRFAIYDSADYKPPMLYAAAKYFGHPYVYMPVSDVEYEEHLMSYEGRRCYVKGVLDFSRTIHEAPGYACVEGAIIRPIEILFDE